ncbi:DUF3558 family protein [Halopolyspora algeriensis]|nr:DUF3558 family protein [Halopolyspora algeriensis]
MRRSAAAAVFAVAALSLSACSGSSRSTEDTAGNSQQPPSSKTGESNSQPLAGVKPCEVFTSEQATKLGLSGPGTINEFDNSTCDWKLGEHILGVSVYKDMALNEINFSGDEKTRTTFQGHDALLVRSNERQCSLAFATSGTTSMLVRSTVDVSTPPDTACNLVKKAAPMVEATIFGN